MYTRSQRKLAIAFARGALVSKIIKYLKAENYFSYEKELAKMKFHHKNVFETKNELHKELLGKEIQEERSILSIEDFGCSIEKFY